jgi:diguanylate cyclase (GGDEF)-like protein
MLYHHLKQGFRLNRTIGFAFLVYELMVLAGLTLGGSPRPGPWLWVRLGMTVLLSLGFLMLNESGLRSFKRHSRMDTVTLEKLSLVMPLTGSALVVAGYLLTGQLGILLFATVILLQSQLFGHNSISRVLLVMFLLLYVISLPMGYPHLLGFPGSAFQVVPVSLQFVVLLLPLIWALAHYGHIVASLVRNTSTRVSKLQSLAATDGLTGLINRRQFNHQLDSEIARARRYRKPLSLALFDIDDFKKINDFYGHPTGDRILQELGRLISMNVREADISARYGGEEFALILPETGQIDAYELLERLRAIIERTVFCLPDNPMTVTISVGVAQLDPEHAESYQLIEKADAALYQAKKQGKNQVVYGTLTPLKVNYPPFVPHNPVS